MRIVLDAGRLRVMDAIGAVPRGYRFCASDLRLCLSEIGIQRHYRLLDVAVKAGLVTKDHESTTWRYTRTAAQWKTAQQPVARIPARSPVGAPAPPDVVVTASNWRQHAACNDADQDLFFPDLHQYKAARIICRGCPASAQCFDSIMDEERGLRYEARIGIYAALSPHRRALLDPTAPHPRRTQPRSEQG